jgi:aspartyl protease family protein
LDSRPAVSSGGLLKRPGGAKTQRPNNKFTNLPKISSMSILNKLLQARPNLIFVMLAAFAVAGIIFASSWTGQGLISGDAVKLERKLNGHFYAVAHVNGIAIEFMVDTGATIVLLSKQTAKILGIEKSQFKNIVTLSTANGAVRAAIFKLDELRLGSIRATDVKAGVILSDDVDFNLLGMSFLNGLSSWSTSGSTMTLTP